jgi:hypothetical protein
MRKPAEPFAPAGAVAARKEIRMYDMLLTDACEEAAATVILSVYAPARRARMVVATAARRAFALLDPIPLTASASALPDGIRATQGTALGGRGVN